MKAAETNRQLARINIKLAPGINHDQAKQVLSKTPGLQSVIQLFPDEKDEEMLSMYILEVASDHLKAAMEQLNQNPKVESANETTSRKLIW